MGHYYDCLICGEEKGAGGCACSRVDPKIRAEFERIATTRCIDIIYSFMYRSEDEVYRRFILSIIQKIVAKGHKK